MDYPSLLSALLNLAKLNPSGSLSFCLWKAELGMMDFSSAMKSIMAQSKDGYVLNIWWKMF